MPYLRSLYGHHVGITNDKGLRSMKNGVASTDMMLPPTFIKICQLAQKLLLEVEMWTR
jgi:hypothetical protein